MFWTTFRWKRLINILWCRKGKGKKIAQFFNEACDCVGYGYVYIVFCSSACGKNELVEMGCGWDHCCRLFGGYCRSSQGGRVTPIVNFPRVSGGDPYKEHRTIAKKVFSPRKRG